jgi:hypothetical protein
MNGKKKYWSAKNLRKREELSYDRIISFVQGNEARDR